MTLDVAKAAAVMFIAAIVQVTLLSSIDVFHGAPNLVLVTLVAVSTIRPATGSAATARRPAVTARTRPSSRLPWSRSSTRSGR